MTQTGWLAAVAIAIDARGYIGDAAQMQIVNSIARIGLIAALVVAVQPLTQFLIAPPDDQSGRWVVTVVALCCAAALSVYLRKSIATK